MGLFKYVLTIIAVLLFAGSGAMGANLADKRILYLNSYHNGYAWSDGILKGIRLVLPREIQNLNFQVEYLDTKQYSTAAMRETVYNFLKNKYRDDRFDVVITSDNAAFEFAIAHRKALFAGVPIVFCGLNNYRPEMIQGRKGITGIAESVDFSSNLEIARKLHPNARQMMVIGNNSVTSEAIIREIKETIEKDKIDFPISFITGFRIEELIAGKRSYFNDLPPDTLIYTVPGYEESNGIFYGSEEICRMVCNAVNLPVYSSWVFLAGTGIVGGKLASGVEHGKTAAGVALRILNGENPDTIPVKTRGGHAYVFDYQVLKRFKVDTSLLPENSRLINQPYNFYRLNRQLFWGIIGVMAVLAGLVLLLVLNMDQKKKANLAMEASKKQLRLIFDSIPHLVFWQDRDLKLVDVNQSFLDFFNVRDKETIIGQDISSVPDLVYTAEASRQRGREILETATPCYAKLVKIQRRSQEQIWLEINKIPIIDKNGQVAGVLSTAEDTTKKINLKKQLAQAQKMEALGILSGGIAHDFNNILTSIINSAELAIDDVPENSMTRKDLERVLSAGRRGAALVKQILTFSRPGHVRFRKMNISRVVADAMALVETSLPGNIEVVTDIGQNEFWCQGDATQIHQVVMNLCTNSFQAMGGMGGRLEVMLRDRVVENGNTSDTGIKPLNVPEGNYVALTVSDNGPGIDPEILDKIFDPFFSTKGKNIGTGLGLSMVHGIVQGHNGGISITSRPFDRTRFTILIPKMDDEGEEELPTEENSTSGQGRILFVEDDPEQRESVPRIIEKLGYRVFPAESAVVALDILDRSSQDYDLVITDYDMPKISGLDLAKELKKRMPDLPVIMVSGRNVEFSRQESGNIKEFIVKPYDKTTLSKAIGDVI
ncbi:MAG: response regulator [Desulfobacter sp.]|nr:MAG: response regulator [Desulfobacter sp.]